MTLQEWVDKSKILPTHPTTEKGAVSLCCDYTTPGREELWHLSDYVVSSAGAVVIWLVPRKKPCDHAGEPRMVCGKCGEELCI